jgi:hypothetical protein
MNKELKMKDKKSSRKPAINKKENFRKISEWNAQRHKPEYKNFQSNFSL